MNFIGIDCSLSSTGMFILMDDGTEHYFNYKNHDKLSKWYKKLMFINYRNYENIQSDIYSETEILKILQYNKITDIIVDDILLYCKPEDTIIITEGYSYSSTNTISLIDLVCYSSLLRNKLLTLPFNDFIIKAPSTLKAETCVLTYGPSLIKNKPSKNDEGIAGGRFSKREMLKAINDNNKINIKFKKQLSGEIINLLKVKTIPKPIDDMADAILLAFSEKLKLK